MSSTDTTSGTPDGDRGRPGWRADEVEPEPGVPAAVPFEVWAAR